MIEDAFRTAAGRSVPAVTADEMREVDRVAVDVVGIDLLQMMENAGRTLSWHVRDVADGQVLVVAGNGGNGGGGLACARHLANRDVPVDVVVDRDPEELTGAAAHQYGILDRMNVSISVGTDGLHRAPDATVPVDALSGYGLSGAVREPATSLIESMNRRDASIVSLDVPSGFDATNGETLGVAADSDRTVTLALPKTGLVDRAEPLFLADISVPRTVYERLDIEYVNPFGKTAWVHSGADRVSLLSDRRRDHRRCPSLPRSLTV